MANRKSVQNYKNRFKNQTCLSPAAKRIEAHICLNFVAYKIHKELERQLKLKKSGLSPETVIDILQSIYEIEVTNSNSQQTIKKTLLLTEEQKLIAQLFDFGC